jgi:carboxymethylenebutenolidase
MQKSLRMTVFVGLLIVAAAVSFGQPRSLPPDGDGAMGRLNTSPRHGEWVRYDAGDGDMVDAYLVYPERSDAAPVVIVIHEIFGLSDWVRSVADEFAAAGFIAIAPDFLSGKGPGGSGSKGIANDQVRGMIRSLDGDEIARRLDGAAKYATSLPAATDKYGVVGYCWGGAITFDYATRQPDLDAAVVFYGTSPETANLRKITAPVLGHYGGNDNRVNATIPDAENEMKRLGKPYEVQIYEGAGHGFLRNQAGQDGGNRKATEQAWPRTIEFFREHLEGKSMMMGPRDPKAVPAKLSGSGSTTPTMTIDMGGCNWEEPSPAAHDTVAQMHNN